MQENKEELFGKGCLDQKEDKRDLVFSAVAPFDWELGFDIELLLGFRAICSSAKIFFGIRGRNGWGVDRYREIVKEVKEKNIKPFKIPVKNQGASSSCTGQGLSYYLSVLNFIETGKWVEISARDIYSYIAIGGSGGAYLRDALKLAVERGIATEELVTSYKRQVVNGREFVDPLSESEYLVKPKETEEIKAIRTAMQAKDYKLAVNATGISMMDQMAWQMLLGFGTYFAVHGENNGTWNSEYPQPPKKVAWGHALFGGKAGLDTDRKIFISPINSWGNGTGIDGWQKLKDNYFAANAVITPWTLIDKDNNWNNMSKTNVKIIKDSNSSSVGVWLPAMSPASLESLCLNFGIETPKKADGSINWDAWIDGTMTLKQ